MILKQTYLFISLCFILTHGVFAQLDKEYQIKAKSNTGLQTGLYFNNTILELGVGHIFIDKPCNRSTSRAFGPMCSFPKKLEVDLTWEYNLQKSIHGQKITLLYTIFSSEETKQFNYKIFYYTFGHILVGLNAINYTDFKSNRIFLRPEVSLMAPQRMAIGSIYKKRQLQMNARLVYGFNITSSTSKIYNMGRHQIGFLFLFLYSRR